MAPEHVPVVMIWQWIRGVLGIVIYELLTAWSHFECERESEPEGEISRKINMAQPYIISNDPEAMVMWQ
jgi:hypothetical protein